MVKKIFPGFVRITSSEQLICLLEKIFPGFDPVSVVINIFPGFGRLTSSLGGRKDISRFWMHNLVRPAALSATLAQYQLSSMVQNREISFLPARAGSLKRIW